MGATASFDALELSPGGLSHVQVIFSSLVVWYIKLVKKMPVVYNIRRSNDENLMRVL